MAADLAHVLTLGIATLDHVFRVRAMPQAAEKFRAEAYAPVPGGCAATAAVAVSRLGGLARLCARLGEDATGAAVVAALEAEGVDCALSPLTTGATSPLSSVLVDEAGERLIVNFRGEGLADEPPALTAEAAASADAALCDTRWPEGAARLMALAREAGIPGIIDGEAPFEGLEVAMELASHVAFSAQGLRAFTGQDDLRDALTAARARLPGWLCVTDGAAGVWFTEGGGIAHLPSPAITPRDTLGAGDVWHGAFALALGEGRGEGQAIAFASAAAALKCMKGSGWASIPDRAATDAFLKQGEAR
jgi:sulfofructose kinase